MQGAKPPSDDRNAPSSATDKRSLASDGDHSAALDFRDYLKARAQLIEQALAKKIVDIDGPASRVAEAMRYSLLAAGKRLRPILAVAACEAVGGNIAAAWDFACAIEMIHTYSLVHDDLPCMDDDDLRRGRPTNHKVYGEAIATLAGDALLTDAFAVLARMASSGNAGVSPAVIIETIAELAEAAGSSGMVGGQVIDLLSEGQPMTLAQLEDLHRRKTAALFVAAVCGGARLGGATPAQLSALRDYARALGLAFQVVDDLLDIESSTAQMGKRTNKDAAHGKNTYPALLGIARSRELAEQLKLRAHQALVDFDERAEPLRLLANFAVERQL